MQRCSHSLSTASALRSIFFPTTNQTCISTFLAPSYATDAPVFPYQLPQQQQQQRQFSTTQESYWQSNRNFGPPSRVGDEFKGNARGPSQPPPGQPPPGPASIAAELRRFGAQKNRRPKDEEIAHRRVLLVGGLTGSESGNEVVELQTVLRHIDRTKNFVVQVSAEPQRSEGGQRFEPPACRVMTRQQYFDFEQKRGGATAARGGGSNSKKPAKTAKQLELSWGIDSNDLDHRTKKALEFLNSGKKVEIILAHKKRGKSTPQEECAQLVRNIKERVSQAGYKEGRTMEGKIGAMATLYFEPKPQT